MLSAFSKLSLAPMIFHLLWSEKRRLFCQNNRLFACVGVRMADYSRSVNIVEIEHEEPAAVSAQSPANGFEEIKGFKELLDMASSPRKNLAPRKSSFWDCNIGILGSGQESVPF
jgi:hypothetical protein